MQLESKGTKTVTPAIDCKVIVYFLTSNILPLFTHRGAEQTRLV